MTMFNPLEVVMAKKRQPAQRIWIAWRRFKNDWKALAMADSYREAWKYLEENPSETMKDESGDEMFYDEAGKDPVPLNPSVVLEDDEHPLGWCKPPSRRK